MKNDDWRVLTEFEDYRVNSKGDVESCKTGSWKPLKQTFRNGYLKVNLCKDGKVYTRNVNNLVGDAFIGKPDGYVYNHKNGIKTDNRIENLEPSSSSDNQRHAYRTGLKKPSYNHPKRRAVRIVETGETFPSEHACARSFENGSQGTINSCLKHPNRTYRGYHFEYA